MNVIKRNGTVVEYNVEKIKKAIISAVDTEEILTSKDFDLLMNSIEDEITECFTDYISIENIQDIVENNLMQYGYTKTAKKYILYREERRRIRDEKANSFSNMEEKIKAILDTDDIENSNANIDEFSTSGQNKRVLDYVNKNYALENIIPKYISDLHTKGIIYEHDLDNYNVGISNCIVVDFTDLFENNGGFKTRNADVRKPNSIMTFFQLVAVVFQLESQVQFGGVASGKIDFEGAPYVRITFEKNFKNALMDHKEYTKEEAERVIYDLKKNNKDIIHLGNQELKSLYPKEYKIAERHTIEETEQACESLYHNLGTLESRQGSQVPFTSINFGLDTSEEGRLISKSLLKASINGIGKHHRTPIFPISIFQHKKGVNANPGDPNYDLKQLAIKSLSKRIYPNFVNCDAPHLTNDFNKQVEMFSTMGQ